MPENLAEYLNGLTIDNQEQIIELMVEYLIVIENLKSQRLETNETNLLVNITNLLISKAVFPKTIEIVILFGVKIANILVGRGHDVNTTKLEAIQILDNLLELNPKDLRVRCQIHRILSTTFHILKNDKLAFFHNEKAIEISNFLNDVDLKSQNFNDASFLRVMYSNDIASAKYFGNQSKINSEKSKNEFSIFLYNYMTAFEDIATDKIDIAILKLENARQSFTNFDLEVGHKDLVLWVVWKKFWSICMLGVGEFVEAEKTIKEAIIISDKYGLGHQGDSLKKLYEKFDFEIIKASIVNIKKTNL